MSTIRNVGLIMGSFVLLSGLLVLGQAARAGAPSSSAATTEPASKPAGKVVAMVNGEPIYESELLASLPDDSFAATLDGLKQTKLARLIQEAIQLQLLAERKITVSPEEMAKGLDEFKQMVKTPGCPCCGGGYQNLDEFMSVNAFTMSEVRRKVICNVGMRLYVERLTSEQTSPQALAEALKKRRAQIEAEYIQGYTISFEFIREPNYYLHKKTVEAKKEKQANDAWRRLKNGDPFEKVAREMSEDDASAPKGGAMGCVRADSMGPEMEKVFHSLEPGTYSGVVKVAWGYCIVMRKKLAEEDIVSVIKEQARNSAEDRVYQEFKAAGERAKIQYDSPSTSASAPRSTMSTTPSSR